MLNPNPIIEADFEGNIVYLNESSNNNVSRFRRISQNSNVIFRLETNNKTSDRQKK